VQFGGRSSYLSTRSFECNERDPIQTTHDTEERLPNLKAEKKKPLASFPEPSHEQRNVHRSGLKLTQFYSALDMRTKSM
jgi:hypothetical protein